MEGNELARQGMKKSGLYPFVMTELTTHAHDGPCCVIYVGYLIGMLK